MSGRRFLQRGHASVPTAALSTGFSGATRWTVVAAAVFVAAGLFVLLAQGDWWSRTAADHLASPASGSSDRTPSSSPSIIEAALAKVDDASQSLQSAKSLSGLAPHALSDDGIERVKPLLGHAEARLIAIYRLISQGEHRDALTKAEQLVRDHPNFHLAHLVHGDLLSLQIRPVRLLGDVPDTTANAAAQQLAVLRDESRRRLRALTERPPEGTVPAQFLSLSPQSRHAIAIDASRSRLYLFENQTPPGPTEGLTAPPRLKLVGDFYISVGLSGIEKSVEGDKRTPLGVYYITSTLDPDSLPDLYGVGALPINYPNPLDQARGKTGSGIWLHGTPREQFVRAPQASDGCVVLSNPDLERLLATVRIRTTPVVIAPELQWVRPEAQQADRRAFEATLEAWRAARSEGRPEQLRAFYASEFPPTSNGSGRNNASRSPQGIELKDVSMLRWQDSQDTMVVTFGELPQGQSRGVTRRQYWSQEGGQWKIFHEGTP
jgi:hypothetical protein